MDDTFLTSYAMEFCLVKSVEEITSFRYGCHTGLKAVKKLYEHRNLQHYPRILPHPRRTVSPEVVQKLTNHEYDGEKVEDIVKSSVKLLGDQKILSDDITSLCDRVKCLEQEGEFTLPRFTETQTSLTSTELVNVSHHLPDKRPLKRKDIPGANVDEVITGLVRYSLI